MKFIKLDLLTLLISLFILSSCKKPDAVGLAIDPSEVINGTLLDTVSINTTTLRDDSVITSNISTTQNDGTSYYVSPLAYYIDPIFGITEANVAMSISTPSSTAFTKPTGTVTVDSAILVLRYAKGFYGDTTLTNYKLNVYQLAEQPLNQNYYNTKTWAFNSALIGTRSFHARPSDSVNVLQIVTGATDTIKKLPPQIRIPMNTAFVKSNILSTDSLKLIGGEAFKRYFKGLYLTFDKAQTTGGVGGNFYLLTDSCQLNIYYKNVSGTTIDTVMASFPASGNFASQIKHNYTGTDIPAALSNTKTAGTIYLQGLAGLRAKISFPSLATNIKQQIGNATLNRAELIVTPVAASQLYPFLPAPRLTMYRYNIAKQRTLIPDAIGGTYPDRRYISGAFGGYYYSTKNEYHFVITGYIQDLISGKTIDYGTFLAPANYYNTSIEYSTGSVYSAGRLKAGGDKSSAVKMKLNIIYTPAITK